MVTEKEKGLKRKSSRCASFGRRRRKDTFTTGKAFQPGRGKILLDQLKEQGHAGVSQRRAPRPLKQVDPATTKFRAKGNISITEGPKEPGDVVKRPADKEPRCGAKTESPDYNCLIKHLYRQPIPRKSGKTKDAKQTGEVIRRQYQVSDQVKTGPATTQSASTRAEKGGRL